MGWEGKGLRAADVRRWPWLSPGREQDHRLCPSSYVYPQSEASCKVGSGCRGDLHFSLSPWSFSLEQSKCQGLHSKKIQPDPLQRPPSCPPRLHIDPNIWGQDCVSGKCSSQGSPIALGRRLVAGHPLATTVSRPCLRHVWQEEPGAARRCQRDGISQATVMNQTFPINNQGGEGETKKQAKATASVKANPVHSLIFYSAIT